MPDYPAYLIVRWLHQALRAGHPPAARREAMLTAREWYPSRKFWAAFALCGLPDSTVGGCR